METEETRSLIIHTEQEEPSLRSPEFLKGFSEIPFAHAGGIDKDHLPNSWAAFEHAIDLGYTFLETDCRATNDGVVVLWHNITLEELTGGKEKVEDLGWEEVDKLTEGKIVRLDALLNRWPQVRVNIDPKDDFATEPLIHLIRSLGVINRICVASFSDRRTARVRKALGPDLCTGLGPIAVTKLKAASLGIPVGEIEGDCVQICPDAKIKKLGGLNLFAIVDKKLVEEAHRRGMKVQVWTVNDPKEVKRLLDLGVDGIMSDDLEMLKGIFQERNIWIETPSGTQ